MLAYESYFNAMASLRTTTNAWKSILAGLVVLRLVDDWLDEGPSVIRTNPASVQAVREALARIPERDPVQPILCDLFDVVTQSETVVIQTIATPMIVYGNALESTGQWNLSLDVFTNLLNRAQTVDDHLTIARTAQRLALVLRVLGQLDASDRTYNLVRQKAIRLRSSDLYARSQSGYVNNLTIRGRLSEAAQINDALIAEAKSLEKIDFYVDCLGANIAIATERRDYQTAIRLCHDALIYPSPPNIKDPILGNLGAAAVGYGDYETARRVLIPLVRTTQEEGVRLRSLLNLLEVAAKEGDKPTFERYRQKLDGSLNLPILQTHYHLFLGKGYHRFGVIDKAIEEQRLALTIAEEYGLGQARTTILEDPSVQTLRPQRGL